MMWPVVFSTGPCTPIVYNLGPKHVDIYIYIYIYIWTTLSQSIYYWAHGPLGFCFVRDVKVPLPAFRLQGVEVM